jgi:hypothetical protein
VAADASGTALPVGGESGVFLLNNLPGDVNGDGMIDVADLVRLLELILGTGDPPAGAETFRADCNVDEAVDALDVVCILDEILGASVLVEEPLATLTLETSVDVRALEFVYPAGSRGGVGDAGPLSVRTGTQAGRRASVAFAETGPGIEAGSTTELRLGGTPETVRAFGEGGSPLPVTLSDGVLRIGAGSGLRAAAARPNPFRAGTAVGFSLGTGGPVAITVHDVRGAVVADLGTENRSPGEHTVRWDGSTTGSGPAAPGLYFLRIRTADESVTRKLIRIAD